MMAQSWLRLSVDIDLVYLGFEPRDEAIVLIQAALGRIAKNLISAGLGASIQGASGSQKLIVSHATAAIKILQSSLNKCSKSSITSIRERPIHELRPS